MVAGTTRGRYEIRHEIGEGGMGVVYLARDTQLHRDVAVKILRPEVANDADRVMRFKLEARAASVLNHPNVITIHDVVEDDDQVLIVSEFVKGTTLREKILRNQLTYADSIRIARQAADALAAAHEVGIVHRDIKPENIMIRHDGYVKVLDFGLAKQGILAIGGEDQTLEHVKTQKGLLLGSISYMSPEQVRDAGFDHRTDIWSLGVVLYEMLTGKNPFRRETTAESIGAILHLEPAAIEKFVPEISPKIAETIVLALQKDPAARCPDIRKFAAALEGEATSGSNGFAAASIGQTQQEETVRVETLRTDENPTLLQPVNTASTREAKSDPTGDPPQSKRRRWRKWLLVPAALVAGVGLFAAYNFFHPNLFPNYYNRFERFEITPLTNDGSSHAAAISPDGRSVVFVRDTAEKQSVILKEIETGTEKEIVPPSWAEFLQPTFSRDGKEIFYVRKENNVGTLYSIDLEDEVRRGGFWSRKLIVDIDSRISFSPDGSKYAFIRRDTAAKTDNIFVAETYFAAEAAMTKRLSTNETEFKRFEEVSWQNTKDQFTVVGVLKGDLGGELGHVTAKTYGERAFFETGVSFYSIGFSDLKNYTWLDDGTYFFLERSRNDPSGQVRYSGRSYYKTKGRITDGEQNYSSLDVASDGSAIAATRTTKLSAIWSYVPGSPGSLDQLIPESAGFSPVDSVSLTANGKILYARKTDDDVYAIHGNNGVEEKVWESKAVHIFIADSDGSNERQLTFQGEYNRHPTATRDGKYVLFVSNGTISRMSLDGGSPTQFGVKSYAADGIQITPDSKTVIYAKRDNNDKMTLMKMSIDGGEPEPLISNSESSDFNPRISPDGKFLAYISVYYDKAASTYKELVIVTSLKDGTAGDPVLGKEFQFASSMHWSPDSKSLCFIEAEGKLRCHSIADKKETAIGFHVGQFSNLMLSADGKKLLFISSNQQNDVVLMRDTDRKP